MQKTLNNPASASLLPQIDLMLAGGALKPQPHKWLSSWLRHIAFYSSAPIADLTQILEGLQSRTLGFYATKDEQYLNPLTPVGLYLPSSLVYNTIQLGPDIEIPAKLRAPNIPLLLLQTPDNAHHWVDLRCQDNGDDFCLPYIIHVDPENSTLPFPAGLVKHLPFANQFLEIAHIPPELENSFWYQPSEIVLSSHWLTFSLASPLPQTFLAPAEIEQLKTRKLKLKCHHVHKRLKYQLTLGSDHNGNVAHILTGSVPWDDVHEKTLPSLIAELLGTYVQVGLLRKVCSDVGLPVAEHKSLEMVQTPHFTVYWRWNTRGVISIAEPPAGSKYAAELFANPADKSPASIAPENETPEAALQRIESLLQQLHAFLTAYQCTQLTC